MLDVRAHDPQARAPEALCVALDYLRAHPPTANEALIMELARNVPGGPLPYHVVKPLVALESWSLPDTTESKPDAS